MDVKHVTSVLKKGYLWVWSDEREFLLKNLPWYVKNDRKVRCRLDRYIAPLNRWLATIRNNRIRWSMNLKNIGPVGLAKNHIIDKNKTWKIMKTNQKLLNTITSKKIVNNGQVQIIASVVTVTCFQKNCNALVSYCFIKTIAIASSFITQIWPLFKSSKMDENVTEGSACRRVGGSRALHHRYLPASDI